MIQDIATGKLGELAVSRMCRGYGLDVGRPDFEVYSRQKKSYDADLNGSGIRIHVKSQGADSASRYGISWILQYGGLSGTGHQDKLFRVRSPKDFLAPCLVKEKTVHIFGIIKVNKLFENDMIDMPSNPWFAQTKRAIFFDKIKTLTYYHRWNVVPVPCKE